jgi:hypothetical protein
MALNVKDIEAAASRELAEERMSVAKGKLKASLRRIADAERILQNAKDDHAVLMRDIEA